MKLVKLEGRLLAIAKLVENGSKVADIGTDHGYIPAYLCENKISDFIIAADVNKGPLEKARKEIAKRKMQDNVVLRLGSGLEVLEKGEVDEVIIAGMGGVLIAKLLQDAIEVARDLKKLILQPMQASSDLRKYLYENGFEIESEKLVREDFRVYEIIVAKYTGNNKKIEDEIELEISYELFESKDELLEDFLKIKLEKYESVLAKLKNLDNEQVNNKRNLTIDKINKIQELIKNEIERDNR